MSLRSLELALEEAWTRAGRDGAVQEAADLAERSPLALLIEGAALCLRRADPLAELVADLVDREIRRRSTRELARLDRALRASSLGVRPERAAAAGSYGARAASLLAVASMGRSGYLREVAVREIGALATEGEPLVVPLLLLRLNDYVQEVRETAVVALEPLVTPSAAPQWSASLPLFEALGEWKRAQNAEIARRARAMLTSQDPRCREALLTATESEDPWVRRSALRLAYSHLPDTDKERTLRGAIVSADPTIRRWAAAMIVSPRKTPEPIRLRLLPEMEASPAFVVRLLALKARSKLPGSAPRLEAALLDPHASVRFFARRELSERSALAAGAEIDFRARYLAALESAHSTRELLGAIAGIGDVGRAEDVAALDRFSRDPRPRVVAEALRAIALASGGHPRAAR